MMFNMIKPKLTTAIIKIVLISPSTPNDSRIKIVDMIKPEFLITL